MSKLILKRNYTTKAQKVKLMLNWLGREYIETIMYNDIVDFDYAEDYEVPVTEPKEVEAYIHTHFFHLVNKHIDLVWESVWEDLSYA